MPGAQAALLGRIGRVADERGVAVYAVGGCVRDWLLGTARTPDLDVTVEGDSLGLAHALARALGGETLVHQQFGTATVTWRRAGRGIRRVDLAMCRREQYAKPGAYPRVSPGTLEEDLFRRDFSINAMAMVLSPARFGTVIDPFDGRGDLEHRRLRMLHARSFFDDPSRLLRGVRFARRFGLRWDPPTRDAAERAVASGALGWLNPGRLERELRHMTDEPDPGACFKDLAALLESA